MRELFLVFNVLLASVSFAHADVKACVQERWNGVIHRQLPISDAFAIHYITGRTIGPDYRTLDERRQREARNATQYALQEALTAHIGTLRKVKLSLNGTPIERSRSYEITGVFIHPSGARYDAQAWVSKKGCKILVMVVERDFLIDWLRETKKMTTFMQTIK